MKYKELTTKPEAEIRRMLVELKQQAHDMAVESAQANPQVKAN